MTKKCLNCQSDRFKIKARGYCTRCYDLIYKLKIIEKWDLDAIKTLKYYPKDDIFFNRKYLKKNKIWVC